MKQVTETRKKLVVLVVFGAAFGYVEAAVVYYLRQLLHFHTAYDIASSNRRQYIGAFMVSFACWDIMYYVFLRVLDNWPSSLLTKDIYFLIPVTWVGPVITPLVISTVLLILGSRMYLKPHVKE